MNSQQAYDWIHQTHVMAGMRGAFPPDTAVQTTELLMEHGISVFELTMNSTQPVQAMKAVKKALGDDALVGMGTVLDVDVAHKVLDAGADFIVSPVFQPDVVRTVLEADVMMAPGVATPSEAMAAWEMGVKLLKLFPIGTLGVDHFKAMFGPLNHLPFMCNGGMHAENAQQFLEAGAVAVGMAGWLTGDGSMTVETMHRRARQLMAGVHHATAPHVAWKD